MSKFESELKISDYNYLYNSPKEFWAWEFTRRNAAYVMAWKKHEYYMPDNKIISYKEMEEAAKFGLLFFC